MPGNKRTYRKRYRKKRRRGANKVIKPESKYTTTTLNSAFGTITTSPQAYDVTATTQGVTNNGNRIGSKIFAKSFELYGIFKGVASVNLLRISLMHVTPDFNVLLDWGVDPIYDSRSQPQVKRVYWDKYIVCNESYSGSTHYQIIKKRCKLNKVVRYEGGASEPTQGKIVLCVVSDDVAGGTDPAFQAGYWRMNYTDA